MNIEENLVECEVCHKKMESRTFLCQHSFCDSCLTDDAKNCNDDTCPKCSAKCQEADDNKKQLPSTSSLCSVCEKKGDGWFCLDCAKSFCSTCSEIHNKIESSKNHKVVHFKDKPLEIQSKYRSKCRLIVKRKKVRNVNSQRRVHKRPSQLDIFYCVDCEKTFKLKFLDSHNNHEVKKEIEFIKETVIEWKDEIGRIKAYEVCEKSHIRIGEKKWMDKKKEILNYKEKVKRNYQKLREVLKTKEALEYKRIDADLSRMQTEFLEHQGKIEKNILSLQEARSKIENKLEEIKKGLPKGFKDECPYELPQMHPHPNLKHNLSFKPIPMEALSQLQSCIMETEKDFNGIYVAEKERFLKTENIHPWYLLDGKYLYAVAVNTQTIFIYSIETFKLIKKLQWPKEIIRYYPQILNNKERFHVIGVADDKKRVITFDEKGVKLDEFNLPSEFIRLSFGEAGKFMITCKQNNVFSYDPVTKELDLIPMPSGVDEIFRCCSMGDGEYCIRVSIKKEVKIVKVVNGKIDKVVDGSGYTGMHSNCSGLLCIFDNKKNMLILDKNLNLIFTFELNLRGSNRVLHVDDASNIHVLGWVIESDACYIRKYKMIPK